MKVQVTGGAGYVGSHACAALAARGIEVIVFDSLTTGYRQFVQWGELIEGDLNDRDAIAGALASVRPDAVMHFAAFALVGESVNEPAKYYQNNVVATCNLLEAMRTVGVKRIVFSSSCATYGTPDRVPISESEKVRIARRMVQTFKASRFSTTIAECSRAVPKSQGMKETFSTGSQNHQPPQPSS